MESLPWGEQCPLILDVLRGKTPEAHRSPCEHLSLLSLEPVVLCLSTTAQEVDRARLTETISQMGTKYPKRSAPLKAHGSRPDLGQLEELPTGLGGAWKTGETSHCSPVILASGKVIRGGACRERGPPRSPQWGPPLQCAEMNPG